MTAEEIEIEVKRRYPKNQDERRHCMTAIAIRNEMRKEYREKLERDGESAIKPGVVE